MQQRVSPLSKAALLAWAVVLVSASLLTFGPESLSAQKAPFAFNDIEQVVAGWSADQHLYVRGDIGVSDQQQRRLEEWLDENAPHWTIVLMDTAQGQTYESVNRRRVTGMDACEYALGHGLTNRTDFGSLIHPETGEARGAVFVLYVAERKFNYLGSLAQDRRGLGETKWNGSLDRAAIRAMRNGGRIIDAVKNTVSSIDGLLTQAINREFAIEKAAQEHARRIELEKKRRLAELANTIDRLHGPMVNTVIENASELRKRHPQASGSPLAKPPTEQWRSQLGRQRAELTQAKSSTVAKEISRIRDEIEDYLDDYAAHNSFEQMRQATEANLAKLVRQNSNAANPQIKKVKDLIADAKTMHAAGLRNFDDQIHQADLLIQQGGKAIQAERTRLAEEAQQDAATRKLLTIVGGIVAVVSFVTMWLLNIRRRPARQRAIAILGSRVAKADAQMEQVNAVVERLDEVLGPKSEFQNKGYEGSTLEAAERTFTLVNLLQNKWDGANRSIDSGAALVRPSNLLARAINIVSPARYDECVHHLNGKSFEASTESGELNWLAFDDFVCEFQGVRERALGQLDELEVSFDSVNSKTRELQSSIQELAKLHQDLKHESRRDRHFECQAFANYLIPAAIAQHKSARTLSSKDPLRAMKEAIPKGSAIVADGRAIAETVRVMRKSTFPILDEASRQLRSLNYETRWIKKRVDDLSQAADKILVHSAENPGADTVQQFATDAGALGGRAKRCAELGQEIAKEVAPALKKIENRIRESRDSIARQLSLRPSQALIEKECNPDTELRQAQRQLDAAQASLNVGETESAIKSLGEVTAESDQATNLIDATLQSLKSFAADHRTAGQSHKQVLNSLVGHQAKAKAAADRYATSALLLLAWNESVQQKPEKRVSLQERLRDCQQLIEDASLTINAASEGHSRGSILEAASNVALATMNIDDAVQWLQHIDDHCKKLDELTVSNVNDADDLADRASEIRDQQDDFRIRKVTRGIFARLQQSLQGFRSELAGSRVARDPFYDRVRCLKLADEAVLITSQIRADQEAHAIAGSTLTDAVTELEVAQRMVHQARNDRVPDSRTVEALIKEVESLASFINEIQIRYEQPHNDWSKVYVDANLVHTRSSLVTGQLRHELLLAQSAVQELQQANRKISEAANWTGGFSVSISDSYGRSELQVARRLLAEGRYKETIQQSRLAYRRAESAIEDAEEKVEAQRRRDRDRRSGGGFSFGSSSSGSSFGSSSSSSSFGSSSSSSSFGSSSSSSGGSSYGSSSSGFGSRSGW